MNNIKINGESLTTNEQIIFWIIVGFAGLVLLLSIGLFSMWIYYSWIRRNNSKNYTGKDITNHIFQKTGTNVEVKKSWFYIKYWNYNKKRGTHKLRPWTYDRRSIWTLMEASQQAYATSIRKEKGKQYWLIFRLPGIFRIIGLIAGIGLMYLGLKDVNNLDAITYGDWTWIGLGITVVFIGYVIADSGRVFVLWRSVTPLLKDSGLQESELKAINRIYFWRLVYSIAVVILELLKLILQIAEKYSRNRK